MTEQGRPTFRTSDGREVPIRPVSLLLLRNIQMVVRSEMLGKGLRLDPPTYKVITAGGDTETFPHDETTLTSDEDKAAWAEYQAALSRVAAESNGRTMRAVLLKGVVSDQAPESWLEERKFLQVPVPKDENERKLEYIQTELLPTPADLQGCMIEIIKLSTKGAPEETVQAAEELFRRDVSRPAPEPTEPEAGPVELQQPVRRPRSRARVGSDAQPVLGS